MRELGLATSQRYHGKLAHILFNKCRLVTWTSVGLRSCRTRAPENYCGMASYSLNGLQSINQYSNK